VPHLPSDRESFVSRGSDEDRRRGLVGQRSKATALARNSMNRMSGVHQLASAMLVIIFAAVMLVAGQLYMESRENRSARIPTAVQTAYFRYDDLLSFPRTCHSTTSW